MDEPTLAEVLQLQACAVEIWWRAWLALPTALLRTLTPA